MKGLWFGFLAGGLLSIFSEMGVKQKGRSFLLR